MTGRFWLCWLAAVGVGTVFATVHFPWYVAGLAVWIGWGLSEIAYTRTTR